jgi:mediator of RNA polymerase II transcription subunit 13
LGKWFVQPQEGLDSACTQQQQQQQQQQNQAPDSSNSTTTIPARNGHLSFSFSFFVHGESTVCASIDVRQHPVVRKTTHRHLAAAQATSGGVHGKHFCNNISNISME